jgi:hypothetical protein
MIKLALAMKGIIWPISKHRRHRLNAESQTIQTLQGSTGDYRFELAGKIKTYGKLALTFPCRSRTKYVVGLNCFF